MLGSMLKVKILEQITSRVNLSRIIFMGQPFLNVLSRKYLLGFLIISFQFAAEAVAQ